MRAARERVWGGYHQNPLSERPGAVDESDAVLGRALGAGGTFCGALWSAAVLATALVMP